MGAKPQARPESRGEVELLTQELALARKTKASNKVIRLLTRQLEKATEEEERLLHQLAHENAQKLAVLAARFMGNGANAKDIAQEAFLSLRRHLKMRPLSEAKSLIESPVELERLMARITACRAYDFFRKMSRLQETAMDDVADIDLGEAPTLDPATALEVSRLQRAYEDLPPAQRIAHVLHHYYGFTDTEFEDHFDWSKTNSRTLVSRATRALKRAMEVNE
jgi:DNA-directed RNA polymerase specialized sigma24 family protein